MTSLARDIRWTLLVKVGLLFLLWLVCFKDVKKIEFHPKQWLQGSIPPANEETRIIPRHHKE